MAVLLTAPATASAATRYVDDDKAQCPGAAHTSILHAVNVSSAGDTIRVCPGVYREQLVAHRAVKIIGVDRDTTVIRQVRPGTTAVSLRRGALLSKVTVEGGRTGIGVAMRDGILRESHVKEFEHGVHAPGWVGDRSRILNNLIQDHAGTGVATGGERVLVDGNDVSGDRFGIVVSSRDGRIQRNTVAGGQSGIHVTNGSYGNIVRKNTVLLGGCSSTERMTNGPWTRWEDNVGGNCATIS